MANYRELLETALNQGARSTKWNIIIPDPKYEKTLSLLAKDVSLPNVGVKSISFKYKGREIPIGGQVKRTNEFSVSFLTDPEHSIRKFFEDWVLKFDARSFESSFEDSTYSNSLRGSITKESALYRNITLMQYPFDCEIDLNANIKPTAQYTMYGCFPTDIGSFSYNNDNESILDLKVQFNCVYYQRDF